MNKWLLLIHLGLSLWFNFDYTLREYVRWLLKSFKDEGKELERHIFFFYLKNSYDMVIR